MDHPFPHYIYSNQSYFFGGNCDQLNDYGLSTNMPISFYLRFQGYHIHQLVSELQDQQQHLVYQNFSSI
jgi:hypothetical protein